jgi:hypothetical protein
MKIAEQTGETAQAKPRRAALAFIFITVVLDMLALGMIVPVLPKLVEDFMHGNTARAAEYVGLFATAWAAMQFLFSPVSAGCPIASDAGLSSCCQTSASASTTS